MKKNILKNSTIQNILISYTDEKGNNINERATLRFVDFEMCYFATESAVNFNKPKVKTPAIITVFTYNGLYKTTVLIMDCVFYLDQVSYETTVPKTWEFIQCRYSSRKRVEVPVSIKYSDGFLVEGETFDISLSGISFYTKEEIPSIYKSIKGKLSIGIPEEYNKFFTHEKFEPEVKFSRYKEASPNDFFERNFYAYRFVDVNSIDKNALKTFLITLK